MKSCVIGQNRDMRRYSACLVVCAAIVFFKNPILVAQYNTLSGQTDELSCLLLWNNFCIALDWDSSLSR